MILLVDNHVINVIPVFCVLIFAPILKVVMSPKMLYLVTGDVDVPVTIGEAELYVVIHKRSPVFLIRSDQIYFVGENAHHVLGVAPE